MGIVFPEFRVIVGIEEAIVEKKKRCWGTTMSVVLRPIQKDEISKAKPLFFSAFPPEERPPFWVLNRKAKLPCTDWLSILHDDTWVGFFYLINHKDLSYLLFFAIQEDQRGKGFGAAALQQLHSLYAGKRVFLSIERVDEPAENLEQRIHRKNFYLRSGFEDLHLKLQEGHVIYEVLGRNGSVKPEEYAQLVRQWAGWFFRMIVTMRILPSS